MKTCKRCSQDKPLEEFHKCRNTKDGRHTWCIACYKVYSKIYEARPEVRVERDKRRKEWQARNPKRNTHRAYVRKYGITHLEKENILKQQNYVCANPMCERTLTMTTGHLDHCHTSKKIRGVLCINCNQGLGHFRDSPLLLLGVIEYLKGSR